MRILLLAAFLPLPAWAEVAATDMSGQAVTLPRPAERVIADTVTGLGQLLALGVEPVAAFCAPGTDPAPYLLAERNMVVPEGLPCINFADWSNDWEAIAAQEPDLFIGWGPEEREAAAGIVPFFDAQAFTADGTAGDSLEGYEASLRAIAALTGRAAEAERAIGGLRDRISAYAALAPDPAPTVIHAISAGDGSFWIFGRGSLNCRLLDEIARCAAPGGEDEFYVQGTSELLLAADPDVILAVAYEGDAYADAEAFAAQMAADPLWAELAAVRAGRVILLPHDARASSIFGVVDYLDTVAPRLHPAIFPAPLTDAEVAAARVGASP